METIYSNKKLKELVKIVKEDHKITKQVEYDRLRGKSDRKLPNSIYLKKKLGVSIKLETTFARV